VAGAELCIGLLLRLMSIMHDVIWSDTATVTNRWHTGKSLCAYSKTIILLHGNILHTPTYRGYS